MDFAATPLMENDRVRLESLDHAHAETLSEAAAEGDLWRTWYTRTPLLKRWVRRFSAATISKRRDVWRLMPW